MDDALARRDLDAVDAAWKTFQKIVEESEPLGDYPFDRLPALVNEFRFGSPRRFQRQVAASVGKGLRGIPPMPAGMPRVQVQFQIDANGILSVTASELRTNVEQSIEVKPSYGLTDDQVEQMLIDSFEHAEADFAARMLIEARNEAESVIVATEKTMRAPEFSTVATEDLAPGEQRRIEQALAGLKHVIKSDDREAILLWTKVLNDATKHLAEIMMNRSVRAALTGKNVDSV